MRFIDLFAGTGGLRLGFEQALDALSIPHNCVFSSEIDTKACEAYELNFGERPHGDITRCSGDIPDFDFLLAGFPCQPFSYAGKQRGFGDTRSTLFFEVEKILEKHRPRGLLLENVRGLTSHDKGRTFKTILHSLHALGYATAFLLCNSSNFGIPQNRVRVYVLGLLGSDVKTSLRSDLGAADSHAFKRAPRQHNLFAVDHPYRVVADILEKNVADRYFCNSKFTDMLAKATNGNFDALHGVRLIDTRGGNSLHSWDLGLKGKCTKAERAFMDALISNRRKKIFGTQQDGKMLTRRQIKTFYNKPDLERVTNSLIKKGYLKRVGGKYNPLCGNMSFEVFKFLDPDSISITLTSSDTNKLGVVQNGRPRRITPREAARLQGFPDSFRLHANDTAAYKQIGNAVSVPVIKAVVLDMFEQNAASLLPVKKKPESTGKALDRVAV